MKVTIVKKDGSMMGVRGPKVLTVEYEGTTVLYSMEKDTQLIHVSVKTEDIEEIIRDGE